MKITIHKPQMPIYPATLLWLFIMSIGILNGYSQTTTCSTTALVGTGIGNYGEFGNGNRSDFTQFSLYSIGTNWKQIAMSNSHSIALKPDGSLWGWGYNRSGSLGVLNTVTVVYGLGAVFHLLQDSLSILFLRLIHPVLYKLERIKIGNKLMAIMTIHWP